MSNGTPPIQPAPSPPSVPGIPQPVFTTGSPTAPTAASWFPQAPVGTFLPPPQVGMGGATPPTIPPSTAPPSVAGIPQPVYGSGSATVPTAASLFPAGTTTPPSPPIVFANIMMIGAGNPPSTPSQPPLPPLPTTLTANDDTPPPSPRRKRAA